MNRFEKMAGGPAQWAESHGGWGRAFGDTFSSAKNTVTAKADSTKNVLTEFSAGKPRSDSTQTSIQAPSKMQFFPERQLKQGWLSPYTN